MDSISGATSGSLLSALASGQTALAASNDQLSQDAQQIASPDSPTATGALLESTQILLLAQTAANVIKTADQMLGSLLDTFA